MLGFETINQSEIIHHFPAMRSSSLTLSLKIFVRDLTPYKQTYKGFKSNTKDPIDIKVNSLSLRMIFTSASQEITPFWETKMTKNNSQNFQKEKYKEGRGVKGDILHTNRLSVKYHRLVFARRNRSVKKKSRVHAQNKYIRSQFSAIPQ